MIKINNLNFTHIDDNRILLKDFSIVLNKGDKVVIIGEEGNGKSTLLKWIYNPSLISEYIEYTGSINTDNEIVGYLPQEMCDEDLGKTVYEYFLDSEMLFDLSPSVLSRNAALFGLKSDCYYSDQINTTLSGGERIKIELLRIMMKHPDVLLLDEPSNDLDIETLEFLEDFIDRFDGIVLYISHDEVLIENTANRIIHLEQIKRKTEAHYTVVSMSYRDYMDKRMYDFERQKQQAISDIREKEKRDEKYRRVYQSVEHALNTVSRQDPHSARNLKDKMHSVKSMSKRFEKQDQNMTKMPEMEEAIEIRFSDEGVISEGKTVLDYRLDQLMTPDSRVLAKDISLYIRGPHKICITGKNGCGKTTLLKEIYADMQYRKDIKVQYMPQNYYELMDVNMTPVEYLGPVTKDEKSRVMTFLGSLKFTASEMNHRIKDLSGGQKAKIYIAKMCLSDASVLLLDEPTRNFSPLSLPTVRKMLIDYKGAIISVSHDRRYIEEVCDTVYELNSDGLVKKN